MKKLAILICALALILSLAGCSSGAPSSSQSESTADYAVYSIYYHAEGGELSPYNPTAYNSFTPSFTLKNPTREGYRFIGWSRSESLTAPALSCEVPKGTTGTLDFFAVWAELFTVRVDSASPEFFTVEYVTGAVLSGETATVRISTAEPVSALQWWGQEPESCSYDESLGAWVVTFTLTQNLTVTVGGVL